ncbi:5'/3'-nucleotidase SurE [Campylobacter canadensis]|uniref:5'-nucleotidase SurE n=1 Tax=Campylobacter canadensis TaxID=449520 RepID=A0ABS7WQW8_9BACT|nr:5'/3'-nucleotidase SurE [Campylobacter canadensis]MBZ7987134.1 5'/3'-nucleotidase SurE [Campylobacter canadensis]MBZ7994512.1 5'/3'-nucleotidase SurE [Campylobacter canadensis]MBZ7997199.1 5'/3'-nucleotidase SurE [Campylobacter canadensis]MBZ7998242.1 5'/3'-nucleotidase SurE [Campylobacter canadensis]MBZ7999773.1 5'/3'-nucleotidase SurE [Campylobacter canadensis]
MTTILLTNDDGYDAKGINILRKQILKKIKDVRVVIVAPFSNKSACAHSITLNSPLSFVKIKKDIYALKDGTPSDCVNLSFCTIFKDDLPNLVVSGINHGANLAEDITYSGTAAACMESVLCGVNAVAFSQYYEKDEDINYKKAAKLSVIIIKKLLKKNPLKKRRFLNINYPSFNQKFKGFKVCKMGKMRYTYKSKMQTNPRGLKYYWLDSLYDLSKIKSKNDDINAVKNNYASITPIKLDLSAKKEFKKVKKWLKK